MNQPKFYSFNFHFGTDLINYRRATACIKQIENTPVRTEYIAVAVCNPVDQYVKHKGQAVALASLIAGNVWAVVSTGNYRHAIKLTDHTLQVGSQNLSFPAFLGELALTEMNSKYKGRRAQV